MIKNLFLTGLISLLGLCGLADTVTINNPGYFPDGIRDGYCVFPDSLCFDSEAEELTFPDLGTFVQLGDYSFPNLKKVTLGSVDYLPGASFMGMPQLEEVVINGLVGHFDCTFVLYCPKLRKITFNGPVSDMGGPQFKSNCPELETVVFNGLVGEFSVSSFMEDESPKFRGFVLNRGTLKASGDSTVTSLSLADIKENPHIVEDINLLAEWQRDVLTAKSDNKWMRGAAFDVAKSLYPIMEELGMASSTSLKEAMDYAWENYDDVKSELEILKESPAYAVDSATLPEFKYATPTDSFLTATRQRFNLDSIAGTGNDISRIKNLLYWVHNNIRHDGSNGFPDGAFTLSNFYDSSRRDSCGYNCRALAICLTEALLAEGIPARYITCQSKHWDTDRDCHVICVAWSESLNKWIWVDPTFCAYVTDENGLMLHPGEVRYRLKHDMPLVLNPDANWNNKWETTKEEYLDEYMAKNLYILSANSCNQAEPEGFSTYPHTKGVVVGLVPQGSNYTNAHSLTTDESKFWVAPKK